MSKYLLSCMFSLSVLFSFGQCTECASGSTSISGTNNINEQNNAANYCIDGDWSGTISNIADGSTLTICPSATWTLPSNFTLSKNVLIENYGTITDDGMGFKFFMQGQVELINKNSGVINVEEFENQDADFTNEGVLVADDIYLHGPSSNSGEIISTATDCGGSATTNCGFYLGNKSLPFNNSGIVNTIDAAINDDIIGGGIFNSSGTIDISNNSGSTDNSFFVNNITLGASTTVLTGDFQISGILECNNANILAEMCFTDSGSNGNSSCSNQSDPITSCAILPVDFIDFSANQSAGKLLFTWEVGIEINVDYYEILISHDGKTFSSLAKVDAISENYYQYQQEHNKISDSYYKLQSVDLDGTINVFQKTEFVGRELLSGISVYPNPLSKDENLTIRINDHSGQLTIKLFDLTGTLILSESYENNNQDEIQLDLDKVNNTGIFTVQIYAGNNIYREKIFID